MTAEELVLVVDEEELVVVASVASSRATERISNTSTPNKTPLPNHTGYQKSTTGSTAESSDGSDGLALPLQVVATIREIASRPLPEDFHSEDGDNEQKTQEQNNVLRHIFATGASEAAAEAAAKKKKRSEKKERKRSESEEPRSRREQKKDRKKPPRRSLTSAEQNPPLLVVEAKAKRSPRRSASMSVREGEPAGEKDSPRGPFRLKEFALDPQYDRELATAREMDEEAPTQSAGIDPSEPDPSRLALDDRQKKPFMDSSRWRQRRYVYMGGCMVFFIVALVAILIPVLMSGGGDDNSGDASGLNVDTPAAKPNDPPSEWGRRTNAPVATPVFTPTIAPSTLAPSTLAPTFPTIASQDVYCFPPIDKRDGYSLWNYTLQVKNNPKNDLCGPERNLFQKSTIQLGNEDTELVLQYTRQSASEVRVLLPGGQPFTYGTYSFHVKSVTVYNPSRRKILSKTLPKELVLGFFTWDDNEAYKTVSSLLEFDGECVQRATYDFLTLWHAV